MFVDHASKDNYLNMRNLTIPPINTVGKIAEIFTKTKKINIQSKTCIKNPQNMLGQN